MGKKTPSEGYVIGSDKHPVLNVPMAPGLNQSVADCEGPRFNEKSRLSVS